jgi:hypothetical protein
MSSSRFSALGLRLRRRAVETVRELESDPNILILTLSRRRLHGRADFGRQLLHFSAFTTFQNFLKNL